MSLFDLVTERDAQEEAADPTLSASSRPMPGSGKTKTLIDRVARLLLAKAKPETILCVTYTKAAASEMQRRLFQVLGGWSVASDVELRKALGLLRSRAPASFDAQDLSEARSLFAGGPGNPGRLEDPDHPRLLREGAAALSAGGGRAAGLRVMDEPAAAAVAAAARRMVAHHVLATPGDLADAYGRLAVALDFRASRRCSPSSRPAADSSRPSSSGKGGLEGAIAWVWRAVDIARDTDPFDLAVEAMGALDRTLYRRAAEALKDGGKTDAGRAATLARLAASDEPLSTTPVALFFTNDGEPRKWISKHQAAEGRPRAAIPAACRAEPARGGPGAHARRPRSAATASTLCRSPTPTSRPTSSRRTLRARSISPTWWRRPATCCATGRRRSGCCSSSMAASTTSSRRGAGHRARPVEDHRRAERRVLRRRGSARGATAEAGHVRGRRREAVDLFVPGRAAGAAAAEIRTPQGPRDPGRLPTEAGGPADLVALDPAGAVIRRQGVRAAAPGGGDSVSRDAGAGPP
jgi:hypothetical protein